MAKYIWKRRGVAVLWFQRAVPADVRGEFGKSMVQECLNTRDPSEAAMLARIRAAQLDQQWAAIRARQAGETTAGDPGLLLRYARAELLNADLTARQSGKKTSFRHRPPQAMRSIDDALPALLEAEANRRRAGLPNGLTVVRQFEAQTQTALSEHDQLNLAGLVDELIEQLLPAIAQRANNPVALALAQPEPRVISLTLEGFRDRYMTTVDVAEHTLSRVKRAFILLKRLLGNTDIRTIGRDQARELRDILLHYPLGKGEGRVADLMPIRDIPKRKWGRTITGITVKQYLGVLSVAWSYAISEGLVDDNPFDGLMVKDDGHATAQRVERRDYSDHELKTLFGSPLFIGCKSGSRIADQGDHKVRDHRYWLPWLSLYSGARLSELCQLEKSNFKQDGKIWYLELTTIGEEGAKKKLKTKQSKRNVPIHRHLIELGFLKYCEAIKSGRLFPAYESAEKLAHEFTKRYGFYMGKIGMTDPALTFHSFRHTFKTGARFANVPDTIHDALTGHAPQSVGDEYGSNKRRIAYLKEQIDKISYSVTPKR